MSIFDQGSGFDPFPWLREKTLRALAEGAALVDLANEPDTTTWYAKTLRQHAGRIVGRLAPVVAYLHGAAQDAAEHDAWEGILKSGSLGLMAWCKRFAIEDDVGIGQAAVAADRGDDERREKAEVAEPPATPEEGVEADAVRLEVYHELSRHHLNRELPEAARRLLAWMQFNLRMASAPDVVIVSKKFLPTDIGCSVADTAAAFQLLIERGILERVETGDGDHLGLRVIVSGINESRHPKPFEEVTFGYPGARIGGKPTIGDIIIATLPESVMRVLERWPMPESRLEELRARLQAGLGEDRIFVEEVKVKRGPDQTRLVLKVRHPLEDDDRELRAAINAVAASWAKEAVLTPKG